MFENAPQQMVVQGNARRQQSERVILLGPNECQLDKLLLDLSNLPGDSSNEDKLQVRDHENIFGKSCHHRIKCTTAAFLAALMWRRPLNSVFNYYRLQKTRKAAQQDRYLSVGLDDKQVDNGNELVRAI